MTKIDLDRLWDIIREELCSLKKEAKCVVLLRKDGLKKAVKCYNKETVLASDDKDLIKNIEEDVRNN